MDRNKWQEHRVLCLWISLSINYVVDVYECSDVVGFARFSSLLLLMTINRSILTGLAPQSGERLHESLLNIVIRSICHNLGVVQEMTYRSIVHHYPISPKPTMAPS